MRRFLLLFALCGLGCGGDDAGGGPDAGTPDADQRMRHSYQVTRLVLPADLAQLSQTRFEFPGTQGMPVNRLGSVLQVMLDLLEGMDVQAQIDANIMAGLAPQGFVLFADGDIAGTVTEAAGSWVAFAIDTDGRVRLAEGESLRQTWVDVSITAGELTGVGTAQAEATIRVPVQQGDPVLVPGVYQQIRGSIDAERFSGAISGAITEEDMHASITPVAANLLDLAVQMNLPKAQQILELLDTNADGRIAVDELIASPLLATLTEPDVDVDGDEITDHISLGVLLEASRVELVLED